MSTKLELVQIDNDVGVILPEALLARLKVGPGDSMFLIETATGVELSPYDPEFKAKLDAARELMRRRRDVLRGLPD